jgi:hypothetical protein
VTEGPSNTAFLLIGSQSPPLGNLGRVFAFV